MNTKKFIALNAKYIAEMLDATPKVKATIGLLGGLLELMWTEKSGASNVEARVNAVSSSYQSPPQFEKCGRSIKVGGLIIFNPSPSLAHGPTSIESMFIGPSPHALLSQIFIDQSGQCYLIRKGVRRYFDSKPQQLPNVEIKVSVHNIARSRMKELGIEGNGFSAKLLLVDINDTIINICVLTQKTIKAIKAPKSQGRVKCTPA